MGAREPRQSRARVDPSTRSAPWTIDWQHGAFDALDQLALDSPERTRARKNCRLTHVSPRASTIE